jgi:hypothetical protein
MTATTNPYVRALAAHREVCAYCTQGAQCAQADRLAAQAQEYAAWEASR